MKNIVIFGSSGYSKKIVNIAEITGFKIIGFIDSFRLPGEETLGYKILGKEQDIPSLIDKYEVEGIFIGVCDNYLRSKLAEKVKAISPALEFITLIHPNATIARNVVIGKGSVIMAGAVIEPDTKVGDFCLLNTHSMLSHDCIMNNFSSLGPKVAVAGHCNIGAYTAINIGSTIINKIDIGLHTVICAGSCVVKDIPSFKVAVGYPARVIRGREADEKYL
ncbi:MAG: acetyltransferase [Chthoniobacterales bacterium]